MLIRVPFSYLNYLYYLYSCTCAAGFLEFQGFTWCSSRRVLLGILCPCLLYESKNIAYNNTSVSSLK